VFLLSFSLAGKDNAFLVNREEKMVSFYIRIPLDLR